MNKRIIRNIIILIGLMILAIIIIPLVPQSKISRMERLLIEQTVNSLNADLPRKLGTIGILKAVQFNDNQIKYEMSVFSGPEIYNFYHKYYDDIKLIFLYEHVIMNAQRDIVQYANYLDHKGIELVFSISASDMNPIEWIILPTDILEFIETCRLDPTESVSKIIDIQINLAKNALLEDRARITNSMLNTIGGLQNTCNDELIDVYCENHNIVIKFQTQDIDMSIAEYTTNNAYKHAIAQELAKNDDILEFMKLLAIARTNLILKYNDIDRNNELTIEIPSEILKQYCKLPNNLKLY